MIERTSFCLQHQKLIMITSWQKFLLVLLVSWVIKIIV